MCGTSSGWGLSLLSVLLQERAYALRSMHADRALFIPTRSVVCRTWRWRLETETVSWSKIDTEPVISCTPFKVRTNACTDEVLKNRTSKPTGTDDGDSSVLDLQLAWEIS